MGDKVERFEDLECWKEARALVKMVYQATFVEPLARDFGLKDQMQRAAVSIMANISEGFEAYSSKEFVRFLGFAKRSCAEIASHLYVASDAGYISQETFGELRQQSQKCYNFIKAFIKYLNSKT